MLEYDSLFSSEKFRTGLVYTKGFVDSLSNSYSVNQT